MARKVVKVKKRVVGWSAKGRPFSQKEFQRSHIYHSDNITYPEYLRVISREIHKKDFRKKYHYVKVKKRK